MAPQTKRARKPRPVTLDQIKRLFPDYPRPSQVKTFYAAVGRAIASWQLVESTLYDVYRVSTRAQRPGAEAAAFYSVPAFRTKLNLTSAAVKFSLFGNDALLSEWKALANQAHKKSER